MFLKSLELYNFRNYVKKRIDFDGMTTVIAGKNAAGKTNILEAIKLLSTGESFRAKKIEEMVNWKGEVSHIVGHVAAEELQVILTRGVVQGKRVQKRSYKVNGVARRKKDLVGNLLTVVFLPEDLELMNGTPTLRRRFLDEALLQVDTEYGRSLSTYERALRSRNRILDAIQKGRARRTALAFWDQTLIKHGEVLMQKRQGFIDYLNNDSKLKVEYDPSVISEKRLMQYEREEVASGYTLVGPHRDDFKVMQERRDLSIYGSRGEQRMGVLWLKMSELEFILKATGEAPTLLLDDIFSELDDNHDKLVMELLGKQQTIITTTEISESLAKKKVDIINLN